MNEIINTFFTKSYEKKINRKLFFYDYQFPTDEIRAYVKTLLDQPYLLYLNFILYDLVTPDGIRPKEVFQYSSFDCATDTICLQLSNAGDEGYKYLDVGKLLLNDGVLRKNGAYTKYGENHAKTAEALGLVQLNSNYCYLSCIGKIYPSLSKEEKQKLLARLVLRNHSIQVIIRKANIGPINIPDLFSDLALSTIKRRRANENTMLELVKNNGEVDLSNLFNNIRYEIDSCEEQPLSPRRPSLSNTLTSSEDKNYTLFSDKPSLVASVAEDEFPEQEYVIKALKEKERRWEEREEQG